MKELGRANVTKEQLDVVFDKEHKGISVKDVVGSVINVAGFVVYDMGDNTFHLKFFDDNKNDFYTSSQVFIKDFMRYAKEVDTIPFTITVAEGESKKGRKFLFVTESRNNDRTANDNWKNINW